METFEDLIKDMKIRKLTAAKCYVDPAANMTKLKGSVSVPIDINGRANMTKLKGSVSVPIDINGRGTHTLQAGVEI
jgi:hypothetical protein